MKVRSAGRRIQITFDEDARFCLFCCGDKTFSVEHDSQIAGLISHTIEIIL